MKIKLELEIKKRDGKVLASVRDEYGVVGYSGPKNSEPAACSKAFQSYIHKTKGKLT